MVHECSLLILTETWLTDSIPDANVDLQGFTAVRAIRENKGMGDSSFISTTVDWPFWTMPEWPLHTVISNQRSLFSDRLPLPRRTQQTEKLLCSLGHQTVQLLTGAVEREQRIGRRSQLTDQPPEINKVLPISLNQTWK